MIFLEKLAFSAPDSARIGRPTTRFFAGINRFFCTRAPFFAENGLLVMQKLLPRCRRVCFRHSAPKRALARGRNSPVASVCVFLLNPKRRTCGRVQSSRPRGMRFCFPLSQTAFLQRGTSKKPCRNGTTQQKRPSATEQFNKNTLSQRNNSTKVPFRKKARSETGLPEIYFCPPWGPPRTGKTCPLTGACPQGDPRGTSSFTPAGQALPLPRDKLFHSHGTSASTPRIPCRKFLPCHAKSRL